MEGYEKGFRDGLKLSADILARWVSLDEAKWKIYEALGLVDSGRLKEAVEKFGRKTSR